MPKSECSSLWNHPQILTTAPSGVLGDHPPGHSSEAVGSPLKYRRHMHRQRMCQWPPGDVLKKGTGGGGGQEAFLKRRVSQAGICTPSNRSGNFVWEMSRCIKGAKFPTQTWPRSERKLLPCSLKRGGRDASGSCQPPEGTRKPSTSTSQRKETAHHRSKTDACEHIFRNGIVSDGRRLSSLGSTTAPNNAFDPPSPTQRGAHGKEVTASESSQKRVLWTRLGRKQSRWTTRPQPIQPMHPPHFNAGMVAPDDTIIQNTLDHVVVSLNQLFPIRIIVQRHFLVVLVRDIGLQSPRSGNLFPSSDIYTVPLTFLQTTPKESRGIAQLHVPKSQCPRLCNHPRTLTTANPGVLGGAGGPSPWGQLRGCGRGAQIPMTHAPTKSASVAPGRCADGGYRRVIRDIKATAKCPDQKASVQLWTYHMRGRLRGARAARSETAKLAAAAEGNTPNREFVTQNREIDHPDAKLDTVAKGGHKKWGHSCAPAVPP